MADKPQRRSRRKSRNTSDENDALIAVAACLIVRVKNTKKRKYRVRPSLMVKPHPMPEANLKIIKGEGKSVSWILNQ